MAATAGTTNVGIIDDLESIAEVCDAENLWLHVDGAYGGAALAAPSVRAQFNGIERADSFIVDPHKWLFAPFDCCALIYRDPETGRRAHRQHGDYLEVLYDGIWNPSDYTQAYSEAVETTITVARQAAELVQQHPDLELVVEQWLSIVVFRRKGWSPEQYQA